MATRLRLRWSRGGVRGACRNSILTDQRFRSRIVMTRHGFGRGEYKYFADLLPQVIAELRTSLSTPCRHCEPLERIHGDRRSLSRTITRRFSSVVIGLVKLGRRRFFSGTAKVITTACIRTFTASMCFRCKSRFCSLRQARLYGRRIRVDRAAATNAVARRGRSPRSGRRRDLPRASRTGAGNARLLSR